MYKIRKIFAKESKYSKEIIEVCALGKWGGVKNWASFKKVILKLMLSKNVNKKKCAPKLIFFSETKKDKY